MLIIGITGGTGSGKTTALGAVKKLGGTVIDCDAVYHELLHRKDLLDEIQARFPGVVTDGELDRKKLGAAVFSDAAALEELNGITHGYVSREVDRLLARAQEAGVPAAAVDAIALIESGLGARCDVTVAIIAPVEQRVRRLMEREGISEQYARMRIAAQKDDEWFCKNCDIVLENHGGIEEFEKQCIEHFNTLLLKDR